ncbi:MAG: fibrobacter succinogenes major paralogous domain-containing protein [Methanococcaceae archaeon]
MKNLISFIMCGALISFLPFNAKSQIKDIDGNVYKTIKIGSQTWFAENLKTTRLNDGTKIPIVEENDKFIEQKTPAVCWYNNDSGYKDIYGGLYNWHTVKTGKLCPSGWHVPSDPEWITMELSIGLTQDDAINGVWDRGKDHGAKLKDLSRWDSPDNTVKSIGFAALPGGLRADDGSFMNAKVESGMSFSINTFFWTSTPREGTGMQDAVDAYFRSINKDNSIERNISSNFRAHSIRCVKD